jgi:integral membrane protein
MVGDAPRSDKVGSATATGVLLVRFRVMAFTTATLLIILVFVGVPLQVAAGRPGVANVVGTIHGVLYLVYLYVAFALTRRLDIPKWQTVFVLVAGTVPFCAFVAERKMTRRVNALAVRAGSPPGVAGRAGRRVVADRAAQARHRWLSRRALVLHLEVAIVAPGCVAAGWWQATRALSGNTLSWVYSIEWPIFALLAVAGWWHLVHEDPEAYRARRTMHAVPGDVELPEAGDGVGVVAGGGTVEDTTARLATALAVLLGVEFVLGIVVLLVVPVGGPSGWLSSGTSAFFLVHALLGIPIGAGAAVVLARVRRSTRNARLSGWIGGAGVAAAGAGGLISAAHPLRPAGIAFMAVGPLVAIFGYLVPTFERLSEGPPLRQEGFEG